MASTSTHAETHGYKNFRRLARERHIEEDAADLVADLDLESEKAPPSDKIGVSTVAVRRVGFNDIQDIGPWLLPALRNIWPNVSDAVWASKFRAWTNMNDASFLRSDNCVGLAIAQQSDMDGKIRVAERFMIARVEPVLTHTITIHPSDIEMIAIYRMMINWARAKQAVRVNVLEHSHILPSTFQKFLGWNFVKRDEFFIRLANA